MNKYYSKNKVFVDYQMCFRVPCPLTF